MARAKKSGARKLAKKPRASKMVKGEIGKVKVVKDFLPAPAQLVLHKII